jgi:hypothetical protein
MEAELVGERARREGAERRDKIMQARIAKEAEVQQDLKQERDKALDEVAARQATIEKLTTARADAEARDAQVQQDLKQERNKALEETAKLKATVDELTRTQKASLEEIAALKAKVNELTQARSGAEERVIELSQRLSEAKRSQQIRAALFAGVPALRFGSIAAVAAIVGFWMYPLIRSGSVSQPTPQITQQSTPQITQQSTPQDNEIWNWKEKDRKAEELWKEWQKSKTGN